jgi:hypothetical protein
VTRRQVCFFSLTEVLDFRFPAPLLPQPNLIASIASILTLGNTNFVYVPAQGGKHKPTFMHLSQIQQIGYVDRMVPIVALVFSRPMRDELTRERD